MPSYRRAAVEGGTYFFTVVTFARRRVLTDTDVRLALRESIIATRTTLPFEIDAWVLLPDHLHCIWTLPAGDADFSTRWRLIKTRVTQRCGYRLEERKTISARRLKKSQSTLWQNRFWEHRIRDNADMEKHVNYIHWNPVKHEHVRNAADWPYSSIHRYIGNGVIPASWGNDSGDAPGESFGE